MGRRNLFLLLFLFGIYSGVIAQVRLLDEENKAPISFAAVTNDGKLICYSDSAGYITLPVDTNAEISIKHIAYETYKCKVRNIPKNILLRPLCYSLKDIEVKASRPDYIKLKGYFRNYEVNSEKKDSALNYYADGIIEYYIPLKGGSVKHRLLEYRSLRQTHLEDKKSSLESSGIFSAKIPKIKAEEPFPEKTDFSKYQITSDGRLTVNGILAGTIRTDSLDRRLMSINMLAPRNKFSLSFFGLFSVSWIKDIRTVYAKLKNGSFSWSGFISQNEYQKWEAKERKKHDIIIDEYSEFYVQEHNYVSKDEIKKIKMTNGDKIHEGQNYVSPYWNEPYIPDNSVYVDKMLNRMMKTH
jgi:hypothetical protein